MFALALWNQVLSKPRITDNLSKVINTKISTILEAIKDQTSQLQAVAARVGEAEKHIADVEAAATSSEGRLAHLEKPVHACWNTRMISTTEVTGATYPSSAYPKAQRARPQ